MKRNNIHSYLLGVLSAVIIISLTTPALAIAQKAIEVSTGVRIFIDDVELHPTDAGGNPVEVFIYNGTTYLPVRAVSEGLDKPVQWDGSTRSVYIGKHSGAKPAVWLKDLSTFEGKNWSVNDTMKDNTGISHQAIYNTPGYAEYSSTRTYLINGQYSAISGTFFQQENHKSSKVVSTIFIYGDGNLLFTADVSGGIQPIDFNVDLTGVLKLDIKIERDRSNVYYTNECAIGECGLWA